MTESTASMLNLNLHNFPLDKHALIEASAGTGKTYAVANLYLRFLLERRLDVSQILVVTFTEAATQELKDRIRARIKELIDVFKKGESDDELLFTLYSNSQAPDKDVIWLTLAQRSIDQAQIYTIHGFCQQILSKHAVDIGLPVNQSLLEDEREVLKQVCEDFWRSKILSFSEHIISEVTSLWAGPSDLSDSVYQILSRRAEKIYPSPQSTGFDAWLETVNQAHQWYEELHAAVLEHESDVRILLERSGLKRIKDKLGWWSKIVNWCASGAYGALPSSGQRKNLFLEFIPAALQAQTKAKGVVPEHRLFSFFDQHMGLQPVPFKESFLVQAAIELRGRLEAHKRNQSIVSFDDLIFLLAQVIGSSAQGDRLCESLRARFRVGLIDEFQDTDSDQYLIFSKIFMRQLEKQSTAMPEQTLVGDSEQYDQAFPRYQNLNALILIGDPKQAIYSFRGGDISTYLRAKADIRAHVRGDIYTMDTNWRSAKEMVAATNYLFSGKSNAFLAEDIPFFPVKASKPVFDKESSAVIVDCLSYDKLNKDSINRQLAEQCVQRVMACLRSEDVENHDIAILVRSANEAELMKFMLARHGLAASYEGKTNVFDSDEAQAISLLLDAVADPGNEHLMMRCLSSLFFGQSDQVLEELQSNSVSLGRYIDKFERLHDIWARHGVLAMVRQSLHEFELYRYWHRSNEQVETLSSQAGSDWERRLSNLNQLAEILQKQSRKIKGMGALLRWFHDHIHIKNFTEDEGKVRLESDEQLIRIVTIHKSKGLEYPYVFLPFLYSSRSASESWFYDQNGALCLDLLQQEKYQIAVEKERLAEDVRLLYVALTRAKYRCFIGTAYYKGMQKTLGVSKTAWARLVFRNTSLEKVDQESYIEQLSVIANESSGLVSLNTFTEDEHRMELDQSELDLSDLGEKTEASDSITSIEAPHIEQRLLANTIRRDWKVQSFTGLMNEHLHHDEVVAFKAFSEEDEKDKPSDSKRLDQLSEKIDAEVMANKSCGLSILDFPKGSRAGTFLHELFEEIEFASALPRDKAMGSVQNLIEYRLLKSSLVPEHEIKHWVEYLSAWLTKILEHRLFAKFSLSKLTEVQYEPELEFYFPVRKLNQTKLSSVLNKFGYEGISFEGFKGHLKGAIDLVFEASGKYYLLDYKSNYLGSQQADYGHEEMSLAMIEHRYDIQYLIYTLAFHRFLSHRLGDRYSYESDFGGVFYLFLRGMSSSENYSSTQNADLNNGHHTGVYFIKPDAGLIKALDDLVGDCAI